MFESKCPGNAELLGLATGTLPDDSARELLDHVGSCSTCEAALETIEDRDDTLLALLKASAPEDPYEAEIRRAEAFGRVKEMSVHALGADDGAVREAVVETVTRKGLGEYEILEKLGEGGMGAVYKARQARLKKIVALKVLTKARLLDEAAVARFEREMEAVGAVDHVNIVRAMDAREIEGTPVLVTEYVEGLNLSDLVRSLGPLRIADACELIRQAANGLVYAHQRGLVHRDIKPSNLMLADSDWQSAVSDRAPSQSAIVKILDLGLARLEREHGNEAAELTGAGQIMGTPDYMAPEQFRDSHDVDIRADIYGLGATLYKLLCGQAPFADRKFETPAQRMVALPSEPVTPIQERRHEVPIELAQVLDHMLAKDPNNRYATPSEVVDALEPFVDGADLTALIAEAKTRREPSPWMERSVDTDAVQPSALVGTEPSHRHKSRRVPSAAQNRRKKLGLLMGGAVVFVAAAAIVLKTGKGIAEFQVDDQDVTITIDGERVEIESQDGKLVVSVPVGRHEIVVSDGSNTREGSFTIRWRWDKAELDARLGGGTGLRPEDFMPEFEVPTDDTDQYGNPVVTRDGKRVDPQAGWPYEIWLKQPRLEFVYIPAGEFLMGSPAEEKGREPDEGPVHRVRITKPFYLGKYEVTNAQYQAFLEATGYDGRLEADDGYVRHLRGESDWPNAADCPIVFVSWNNMMALCRWLTKDTGVPFRLPTEAEWEYACRAGSTTRYHFGDDPYLTELGDYAWHAVNSGKKTYPVGKKKPNQWGLYDMHGNTLEWCLVCAHECHWLVCSTQSPIA
ncbi:MAG: SUMF1/EgtB/PvdO family nonheme iron enzyme, partial [Planctomycetes bacterium]|nr:SUMF1/EgtB/PvdO family nonheme iron enzyme [Planctomycetota bacterium]